jgi:hypothetical protein
MLTHDRPFRGYTMRDLHACADREARRRQRVYPNRILTMRMRRDVAELELDLMLAIAEHFAELAEQERLL